MAIRIENQYEGALPKNALQQIEEAFDSLPREHTRGLERIRLVPFISDPRIRGPFQATELPGLYHPRQGPKGPWLEIAINVLLSPDKPFLKRIIPRLSFKSNVVALVFSLVGQHYHLTLRHSLKKTQLEPAIRAYTEKQMKSWNEKKHTFRAKLFKPLQPTFERWAKGLQKRAAAEKKKSLASKS
ncbi:MAG TPA: hypothetical protein VLA93_21445 [Pyrinomonadaceae bacterium]|nr:hypothetical protein [Pyrinomonadaceae bacterium]